MRASEVHDAERGRGKIGDKWAGGQQLGLPRLHILRWSAKDSEKSKFSPGTIGH